MTAPSPRLWLATFVALVFSIGVLAGIVLERRVLQPDGGQVVRGQGPGGQGGRGLGGPGGPGLAREGRGRGGQGRGGGPFGPPPALFVQELTRELQLTDAQQAAILALLDAQETRLRRRQDEARAEFTREQDALHTQIAAELTAEQAAAFRTWIAQRLSRPPGR